MFLVLDVLSSLEVFDNSLILTPAFSLFVSSSSIDLLLLLRNSWSIIKCLRRSQSLSLSSLSLLECVLLY